MVNLSSFIGGAAGGATVNIVIRGIDRFSSTFSRARKGIKGLAAVAKIAATSAVLFAGAMAAVGVASLKAATNLEQTKIAFETFLGSAEKADDFLRQLADFAKRTPFTIQGVELAARQLTAVGFEADRVIPLLKTLGDVAAGLGRGEEGLKRLILNLGQVQTQGKLTGRELKDFAVLGVPLIDELAKSMGVAKEEIVKLTSAGKITSDVVIKAFEDMAGEGGRFENLMGKLALTVSGKFSNLKDAISIVARDIGAEMLPAAGNLADVFLKEVVPILEDLVPLIGKTLGSTIKGITPILVDMIEDISVLLNLLLGGQTEEENSFVKVVKFLGGIIDFLVKSFAGLKLVFGTTFDLINSQIARAVTTFDILTDSTLSLTEKFTEFKKRNDEITESLIASIKERKLEIQLTLLGVNATDQLTDSISEQTDVINEETKALEKLAAAKNQAGFFGRVAEVGRFRGLTQSAIQAAFKTREGTTGGSRIVNDFISRPGQPLQQFSSADTIIGTKDPGSLGGGIQGDINIEINAAVSNEIDMERLATQVGDTIHERLTRR